MEYSRAKECSISRIVLSILEIGRKTILTELADVLGPVIRTTKVIL